MEGIDWNAVINGILAILAGIFGQRWYKAKKQGTEAVNKVVNKSQDAIDKANAIATKATVLLLDAKASIENDNTVDEAERKNILNGIDRLVDEVAGDE